MNTEPCFHRLRHRSQGQCAYRIQGCDYRLTDVHGHVVKDILA